jgi:hypothetical protein
MSYQGRSLEFLHGGNSSSHFERRGIVAVPCAIEKRLTASRAIVAISMRPTVPQGVGDGRLGKRLKLQTNADLG